MNNANMLQQRWIKILPHTIDSLLLCSAAAMMFLIDQYPFSNTWLTAKLIALLLYIALGLLALRFIQNKTWCCITWISAQLIFIYIVLVAKTNQPIPFGMF